jgi:hypothetical protein
MQKKFEQTGAIQLVSLLQGVNQVRDAGTFDRGVHLRLGDMKLVGQAQIGWSLAVLQRELEEHNEIERLEHRLIAP